MSNNKKESSNKDYKDIELTSRVNRILCDEVKDSISSLNNAVQNLADKNLDTISTLIFHNNKEIQGLDEKAILQVKKALKQKAKKLPSLFTFNEKGKCDLWEKLSAFIFSEFVKDKVKKSASKEQIRNFLDKQGIKGLKGAVKLHQEYKRMINGTDNPSGNRPKSDKIDPEKVLTASQVKNGLINLPIGVALDICKEFIEDNTEQVKKAS